MKKISAVRVNGNMIFKGHKLAIGVDLGDRWSCYCVLDEACEILLEQKVATTPEAMKHIFERIPHGLIAMETGTHSPWVREKGKNPQILLGRWSKGFVSQDLFIDHQPSRPLRQT